MNNPIAPQFLENIVKFAQISGKIVHTLFLF